MTRRIQTQAMCRAARRLCGGGRPRPVIRPQRVFPYPSRERHVLVAFRWQIHGPSAAAAACLGKGMVRAALGRAGGGAVGRCTRPSRRRGRWHRRETARSASLPPRKDDVRATPRRGDGSADRESVQRPPDVGGPLSRVRGRIDRHRGGHWRLRRRRTARPLCRQQDGKLPALPQPRGFNSKM